MGGLGGERRSGLWETLLKSCPCPELQKQYRLFPALNQTVDELSVKLSFEV